MTGKWHMGKAPEPYPARPGVQPARQGRQIDLGKLAERMSRDPLGAA